MIPEEMQRTMQFLLENQAGHDARLAEIEVNLNKLTAEVSSLANTQQALANTQLEMQTEFREGLAAILTVSQQTQAAVRQVAVAVVQALELEGRTVQRVNALEERVDALEDSGK